jgi:hypothetical protein
MDGRIVQTAAQIHPWDFASFLQFARQPHALKFTKMQQPLF